MEQVRALNPAEGRVTRIIDIVTRFFQMWLQNLVTLAEGQVRESPDGEEDSKRVTFNDGELFTKKNLNTLQIIKFYSSPY